MTPMDRESRNRITTFWVQHVYKLVGAVYAKGAALKNCLGFADGTVRPIARPDESQKVVYNGHKRVHALKFQCVALYLMVS